MKKLLTILLSVSLLLGLTACTSGGGDSSQADSSVDKGSSEAVVSNTPSSKTSKDEQDTGTDEEPITIKVFSNLTDRKSGQGLIEQMLFDSYMKENPHITIEVEALDDEAYKTKFKAYASGSGMPDLVNAWGQPSFLDEVIEAGLLAELDTADYEDYGFIEGSLNGFSSGGKLYGLPRNTDIMGFYYNKALFEENGWEVPATYQNLLDLSGDIKAAGLIPVSMDGADKWPISIFYHDILAKLKGPTQDMVLKSIEDGDFSDPSYTEAAQLVQAAYDVGMFQNGFETTDYGTSLNLFANGQAAMFYMGSWEMSMATNEDVLEEVRENIGVFMMPIVEGGEGTAEDITAWNGGGYAVSEGSAVKEEAIKLLNYMFLPENWSKLAWENNVCMSAQDFSAYLTGDETPVQTDFVDFLTGSSSITGVTFNDLGTSEFKTITEDLSQQLVIKDKTPEEFVQEVEAACK